jgi:uncharacterized membrane protein YdbT with pleckstrin-like domain
MPYPKKLLNDYEELAVDLHPHWWYFAETVFAFVVSIVIGVVVLGTDESWLKWTALALIVASAIWLLIRYLKWATTNFVITSDRVIFRHGVIAKSGIEIPLERINTVFFNQTIFERMLRAGDLVIESGGERGNQSFTDIPKPSLVQNEIYRQIEAAQARDADRMAGRRQLSVPEQIEKLDELRSRGVISQAEFDAKKAQLLDRL